jgi:hypothetical protein
MRLQGLRSNMQRNVQRDGQRSVQRNLQRNLQRKLQPTEGPHLLSMKQAHIRGTRLRPRAQAKPFRACSLPSAPASEHGTAGSTSA